MTVTLRTLCLAFAIGAATPIAAIAQATTPQPQPTPQPRNFDAAKAHRLEEISRHIAEMQRVQMCVQNATDFDQMQACRPQRRAH
jgi:hypothetical protein